MVKTSDIYGGRYKQARLEVEQVREARRRVDNGESQRKVASALGVSQSAISRLASGKRWKGK